MSVTKLGLDGGVSNAGLTGPISQTIGLATEIDTAQGFASDFQELQITALGIAGGVGNGINDFTGKVRFIGVAEETDAAQPAVDTNDLIVGIGLAAETDSAYPFTDAQPLTVTLVSSIRGSDIITANTTLTVNVNDSSGNPSITVNGVAASNIQIITPTEITCVVPLGIGAPYFTNVDIVVTSDAGTSLPYSLAEWQPPDGMVETDFDVNYLGLDLDSPFSGDPTFIDLDALDSCIYDALTTPDSLGVSMDGNGEFTITGTITQIQTFDYYIYDLSDNTVSATIEQITVQPGPVEVEIGLASETDTAYTLTSQIVTAFQIGVAAETDTAFALIDGSGVAGVIGLASEIDSALTITGVGPIQSIAIGLASEADTAFGLTDASIPAGIIGLATENDFAFPIIDAGSVRYVISQAIEVDSAIGLTFPADLDSIRDQIEALETIILAQQQQIFDLYTRFDLDTAAPNTYRIDGATIVNNEFTLTKTDNLDGTFTIEKT